MTCMRSVCGWPAFVKEALPSRKRKAVGTFNEEETERNEPGWRRLQRDKEELLKVAAESQRRWTAGVAAALARQPQIAAAPFAENESFSTGWSGSYRRSLR